MLLLNFYSVCVDYEDSWSAEEVLKEALFKISNGFDPFDYAVEVTERTAELVNKGFLFKDHPEEKYVLLQWAVTESCECDDVFKE